MVHPPNRQLIKKQAEDTALIASLLEIASLLGFQQQTEKIAQQTQAGGGKADCGEVNLDIASVVLSMIRFIKLLPSSDTLSNSIEIDNV